MASTHYVVAGAADSLEYARAERLADLVAAKLAGKVEVVKLRKPAAAWPAARERIRATVGIGASASALQQPVIFTREGRYIGDGDAFEELCRSTYGVTLDLADAELGDCVKQNIAESQRQARQCSVARQIRGKRALVIIDVQNDFCGGGSLAVPDGDAVVPLLNQLRHTCAWDCVVLTQDWHPREHASFASNNAGSTLFTVRELPGMGAQMMWPDHCVQGTPGAEFHPHLDRAATDIVVRKGKDSRVDSYSGFGDAFGHKLEKTELLDVLRSRGITDLFVAGLALDYCVAYTCKDGAKAGFNVFCVTDASRGIAPESVAKEMDAMTALGVHIVSSVDEVPTHDIDAAMAAGGSGSEGGAGAAAIDLRALLLP